MKDSTKSCLLAAFSLTVGAGLLLMITRSAFIARYTELSMRERQRQREAETQKIISQSQKEFDEQLRAYMMEDLPGSGVYEFMPKPTGDAKGVHTTTRRTAGDSRPDHSPVTLLHNP